MPNQRVLKMTVDQPRACGPQLLQQRVDRNHRNKHHAISVIHGHKNMPNNY